MKDYKEMTKCVLEARDEYVRNKQRKKLILQRCIPAVTAACAALIVVFGISSHKNIPTRTGNISSEIIEDTTANTHYSETMTSVSTTEINKTTTVMAKTSKVTGNTTVTTSVVNDISAEIINISPATETNSTVHDIQVTENGITEPVTSKQTEVTTEQTEITADTTTTTAPDKDGKSEQPKNHEQLRWDEMAINQQYFMADFRESQMSFSTAEKEVPADEVGDYICNAFMSGYDSYTDTYYHCEAEAFLIKGHPVDEMIAIQFEGSDCCYVYVNNANEENENMTG